MTCGYCRDCKHWEILPGHEQDKMNQCEKVETLGYALNPDALAQACGYDDSGILFTAANFGCVQFEAKQ